MRGASECKHEWLASHLHLQLQLLVLARQPVAVRLRRCEPCPQGLGRGLMCTRESRLQRGLQRRRELKPKSRDVNRRAHHHRDNPDTHRTSTRSALPLIGWLTDMHVNHHGAMNAAQRRDWMGLDGRVPRDWTGPGMDGTRCTSGLQA